MYDVAFRTLFIEKSAKLRLKDKHIYIEQKDENFVCIPLSDVLCVMLESREVTLSTALLSALAEHKIICFVCDRGHLPNGVFMPFLSHYHTLGLFKLQVSLASRQKSLLWQKIIKQKLLNQSHLLFLIDCNDVGRKLENCSKKVLLGDSGNEEAKGAKIYFRCLFGKNFKRDMGDLCYSAEINAINSALNYGYAIVRGAVIRSLCVSGLNPLLGIFHSNENNPFNLADDLMEPYRIFVDWCVYSMDIKDTLTRENRTQLAKILHAKVLLKQENKYYAMYAAIMKTVWSFIESLKKQGQLELPIFNQKDLYGREFYESVCDV